MAALANAILCLHYSTELPRVLSLFVLLLYKKSEVCIGNNAVTRKYNVFDGCRCIATIYLVAQFVWECCALRENRRLYA